MLFSGVKCSSLTTVGNNSMLYKYNPIHKNAAFNVHTKIAVVKDD